MIHITRVQKIEFLRTIGSALCFTLHLENCANVIFDDANQATPFPWLCVKSTTRFCGLPRTNSCRGKQPNHNRPTLSFSNPPTLCLCVREGCKEKTHERFHIKCISVHFNLALVYNLINHKEEKRKTFLKRWPCEGNMIQ